MTPSYDQTKQMTYLNAVIKEVPLDTWSHVGHR